MNIKEYIRQLADDYKGHTSASGRLRGLIYSSADSRPDPCTDIFIGDVIRYICRFHVIDEYMVTFVSTDE
jgi:hypothetical protein